MYVKIVTLHKREDEKKWNHLSTAIYDCNKVRIVDMSDGREININCKGDKEEKTLTLSRGESKTEKADAYIENEKGDTIGRY